MTELKSRGPGLTPELVQRVDPARVCRAAGFVEESVAQSGERVGEEREILLADHRAFEIALSGRVAEGRVGKRGGDREAR